jgi:hypothetical protein
MEFLDVDSLQCFTLALQIPVLTWIREMERRKKVAWGTLNDMLPTLLSPYPTREEERPSLEKRSQMTSLLGKPVLLDTFKIVVLQEQQMGIAGIAVVRLIRSVAEESSTGTLNVVTVLSLRHVWLPTIFYLPSKTKKEPSNQQANGGSTCPTDPSPEQMRRVRSYIDNIRLGWFMSSNPDQAVFMNADDDEKVRIITKHASFLDIRIVLHNMVYGNILNLGLGEAFRVRARMETKEQPQLKPVLHYALQVVDGHTGCTPT